MWFWEKHLKFRSSRHSAFSYHNTKKFQFKVFSLTKINSEQPFLQNLLTVNCYCLFNENACWLLIKVKTLLTFVALEIQYVVLILFSSFEVVCRWDVVCTLTIFRSDVCNFNVYPPDVCCSDKSFRVPTMFVVLAILIKIVVIPTFVV